MNKTLIYIVGGTVLVGGAYLFLKNKKEKDLSKLAEIGGTTSGGTTTGGTKSGGTTTGGTKSGGTTTGGTTSGGTKPPLSTVSDGVSPSDANLNLANATVLVGQRAILVAKTKQRCVHISNYGFGWGQTRNDPNYDQCNSAKLGAIKQLPELDKKLATLGYKVDAIGQLVKI
jgi:hypothetical protein